MYFRPRGNNETFKGEKSCSKRYFVVVVFVSNIDIMTILTIFHIVTYSTHPCNMSDIWSFAEDIRFGYTHDVLITVS